MCDCVSVYGFVCISEEMRVWRWRGTSRKRGKRFAQIQLIQNTRLRKVFAGISVLLLRRKTTLRRIPQLRQRRRRRQRWRWWWRSPGDELHAPCRDDDVKKADEYWWEWGMACLPRAPPSHHGANLAWGLMTDDDGNTTVIQNGDLNQLLACDTALFHLTIASHHLYLLLSFWGRMVALHTFPSSSLIWLAASLLLGSSLQTPFSTSDGFSANISPCFWCCFILLFSLRFLHDFLWNTYFYI